MRIGIDFAYTITKYPEGFRVLCEMLMKAGHEIFIISGINLGEEGHREEWLTKHKIPFNQILEHYNHEHTDGDKIKGKQCRDNEIDLMFDDDDGYIEDIKRWSPDTKIIKVFGKLKGF